MTDITISEIPIWMIIGHLFELFVNCLALFLAFLSARAITRHRLFHSNLRLLMHVMGIGYFILVGSRMASLIHQFLQPEGMLGHYILLVERPFVILEICRVFGCTLIVTGAIVGIFERIVASIMLDKYEKKTHTLYICLGLLASSPSNIVLSYYSFSIEYGYIIALIAGGLGITVFMVFILVDRWNKRRLELSIKHGINYTLNQRFQLSENIRASALVFRASTFGSAGSIGVVTLIILYRFVEGNNTQVYILRILFNLYVAFYNLTLCVILVTQPTAWRRDFLRQLRNFCPFFIRRNQRISSLTDKNGEIVRARIQNLDGIQLEFSQDIEARLYFQQLEKSWNI